MLHFAANLSLMFTELPFLARFEAAAAAGFQAVECQFPYEWSPGDIATELARHDLRQVLINAPPGDFARGERGIAGIPGREAEFLHSIETALSYARALACPRVHVMAGLVQHGADRATLARNLRRAAELAAVDGVMLLVEPINPRDIPGYLVNRTLDALAVIAMSEAAHVRLQFDLYHRQLVEGDLLAAVREFAPHAAHVQIAQPPDRGEPDEGEIHYPTVLSALEAGGYEGWIGCEYRPRRGTLEGLGWLAPYRAVRPGRPMEPR